MTSATEAADGAAFGNRYVPSKSDEGTSGDGGVLRSDSSAISNRSESCIDRSLMNSDRGEKKVAEVTVGTEENVKGRYAVVIGC
jgi:hypothetical protein